MLGPIERVLAALNAAEVRYLVVGGVAVVLHGHLRTTADLDLVIQLQPDNVRRALGALEGLGYRPRAPIPAEAFADPVERLRLRQEKQLTVFSFWSPKEPTFEVDLFASEPFDFEAVHARALRVPLDEIEATVIGMDDLIALKEASGRPRDHTDIGALRALRDVASHGDEA